MIKVLTQAVEAREVERKNRYIQQAGFDVIKPFETFDFSGVTLPGGLSPEVLKSCEFVQNKQNLILYGLPGTGKSHLASSLGVEACRLGYKVLYFKTSRLVNLLSEARKADSEARTTPDA